MNQKELTTKILNAANAINQFNRNSLGNYIFSPVPKIIIQIEQDISYYNLIKYSNKWKIYNDITVYNEEF